MRIRTRIMLAIMFAVALSVAGITAMVSYEVNKAFTTNFTVSSKAQLERMNAFINTFFGTAIANMERFSNSPLFENNLDSLTKYLSNEVPVYDLSKASDIERQLSKYMHSYTDYFSMITVMYVASSAGGIVLSPHSSLPAGYDPLTRVWYKAAVKAGKIIITPAYLSTEGMMVCSVVSPLMSPDNKFLGVGSADISLDTITKETAGVRIGKTGYVLVLDHSGQVVSAPQSSSKSKSTEHQWLGENIKDLPEDARVAFTTLQNMASTSGAIEVTIDGKVWLTAVQKTDMDWTLIMLQQRNEVFADAMQITLSIFLVGLIIFVIMLVVAWLVARSIARPVSILAEASQKVANGDLKAIPDDEKLFQGELGVLHRALKGMVLKLVELISMATEKIKEAEDALILSKSSLAEAEEAKIQGEQARRQGILQTADDIGSAIDQLSVSTENLAHELKQTEGLTEAQRSRIAHAATGIAQMNAVVKDIATSGQRTASLAEQTYNEAQQGRLLVGDVVSSMNEIESKSAAMRLSLEELTAQAESIDVIMSVISDIADQTNLLALNAAIEAARAGEAGRGFAVVADEVRKLAEKTMEATKGVNEAITNIQKSTQSNMNAMQETATYVSQSTGVANQAGGALASIETMVDNTANEIRSIAKASEDQVITITEVNKATQEVHELMDEVVQGTQRSNKAIAELSTLSQRLNTVLHDLRKS